MFDAIFRTIASFNVVDDTVDDDSDCDCDCDCDFGCFCCGACIIVGIVGGAAAVVIVASRSVSFGG